MIETSRDERLPLSPSPQRSSLIRLPRSGHRRMRGRRHADGGRGGGYRPGGLEALYKDRRS